jgi:putative transposase
VCPRGVQRRARLTAVKATPERAWLAEVSAVALQQALADLNAAYRNFFSSAAGKRAGPKVAPPRFRSRKDARQAIRFTRNARFAVTAAGRLRLPKIGDVPVRWSRPLPTAPSSVTVISDAAGRYFASFVVQTGPQPLPACGFEVGIDLGLTAGRRSRPCWSTRPLGTDAPSPGSAGGSRPARSAPRAG